MPEVDNINKTGSLSKRKGAVGAIIVAAGKGSRMGLGYNKVLANLRDRPVIEWTIRKFVFSELIDTLVLVINPEDKEAMMRICEPYTDKIEFIMENGGESRQDSVYNGLKVLPKEVEIVLIHDGARPFVNRDIIENSIEKAEEFGAVCVGLPAKDTIKIVDNENVVQSTPERVLIWHAQTPQSFKKDIITKAYEHAREKGIRGTDDAGLAEWAGYKVTMFEGSSRNVKLTSAEDLILGEYFIGMSKTEF
ncbi:MAG: 2-C-methyl-D-erythritol 4-phosphate cytidylyltransferase [Clostridiaceae bacterium]|nr:2-C-methyl-D-erythritol 4-phosphate cytidylyltransferase [Clostridiaceae bacterium]